MTLRVLLPLVALAALAFPADAACTLCYYDVGASTLHEGPGRDFCLHDLNLGPQHRVLDSQAELDEFSNLFVGEWLSGVDWESEMAIAVVANPAVTEQGGTTRIVRVEVNDQPQLLPARVHLQTSVGVTADGAEGACAAALGNGVHVVKVPRVESVYVFYEDLPEGAMAPVAVDETLTRKA